MKEKLNINYNEMFEDKNYFKAYDEIKSKPGNMTPGVDNETLDGFSIKKIENIIKQMKNREFKFKPSKKIYILKSNGKQRPLGIPSPMDKIVQKVYTNILSKEYEKVFLNTSHGFRPNKSCHTALKEIKKWTGTTWIIEGDIKSYFDNIDHDKLAEILKKRIMDVNMINLYRKLVKAGYIEKGEYKPNTLGIPQGGIVSPLLSNIYLHELDEYIEKLKQEYNTEIISKPTKEYSIITNELRKARRHYSKEQTETNLENILQIKKKMRNINSVERVGIRISYIRYADDFLIGVIGTKATTIEIRNKVKIFLEKELKIELNLEKTKITNIRKNNIKFLGYHIRTTNQKYYQSLLIKKTNSKGLVRPPNGRIKLIIPLKDLILILEKKGFIKNNKGIKKSGLEGYTDYEIIIKYLSILRGLYYYYLLADNISRFGMIAYFLIYSAAHTLASKYKSSITKIFKKYGKTLKVQHSNQKGKLVSIELNIKNFPKTYKVSEIIDPFKVLNYAARSLATLNSPCSLCGAKDNIEMHHVKHLKNLNPKLSRHEAIMVSLKRKQIPVCKNCHNEIHRGKYDGKAL